ncbi:MAG TPA: ABC transporter permease [Candidatus Angelobacter sp.]|nr:ABC transporter permease [Candidatus Angelobacter sp.]
MVTLIQDLRYALRMLRKNPAFTTVAVLTLALGIGANTAIFTLVNAVMLKMLPVKDPGQLVVVGDPIDVHHQSQGDPRVDLFSHPLYRDLSSGNQVFSGMLASGEAHRLRVTTGDSKGGISANALGTLVSGNYFSVLGVNALYGRVLTADDDTAPGGNPVAVVSYAFWTENLGQNPGAVGRTIRVNDTQFTIVGVAPAGFFGDTVGDQQEIWVPVTMQEQLIPGRKWLENYNASWLHCIARLRPGVSIEQAQANLNLLLQQLVNGPLGAKLNKDDRENLRQAKIQVSGGGGGFSELRGDFQTPLYLLTGIVGLVLLIACVNVANLLLARAAGREREIAVRMAIGAAPWRVVRQLLTESVLLAFAGGLLGLLVAHWGTAALLTLSDNDKLEAAPDLRVFLFTAAVCLLTGILFGLVPALRSRDVAVVPTLKAGVQLAGQAKGKWNWSRAMVSAQVTFSLLVLFAAGLLVRSVQNIRRVDLGYERDHLLIVSTDPISGGYHNERIAQFGSELSARFAAIPGVRGATYSKNGLFSGSESDTSLKVEGYTGNGKDDPVASYDQVGADYFRTVGIPLLVGRDIDAQDTAASTKVAVINETMARMYLAGRNPIGRKLEVNNQPVEIVGVARDARDHQIRAPIRPRFYVPATQLIAGNARIHFELRISGDGGAITKAVREQLKNFDANVPVYTVSPLNKLTERMIGQEILIARLSSFFAGLALLLAAIGLYGTLSYSVAGRTREIGVRMALGARRGSVLLMVLSEAGRLVIAGVLIGVPAAMLSSRALNSMLFGIGHNDPTSMALVIAILAGIALLASFIPARRATKVDPMVALRYE